MDFLVWFILWKAKSILCDCSLTAPRLAILGLCVEVAQFPWFLRVEVVLSGIGMRPFCDSLPLLAEIVNWWLTNRPDLGWMRILSSWRDYLFAFHWHNFVLRCPPKCLQASPVCQLSLYCSTTVNMTFFRKHQLCDCYFLQVSGDECVCWV